MPRALWVVGLAAAAGFSLLASHVVSGAADAFDRALTDTVHVHISYPLRAALVAFTRLGNGDVLLVATGVIATASLIRRQALLAAMWVLTMAGGFALTQLVKAWIARARPPQAQAFLLTDGSFPSGHTSMAVIVAGFALYLFLRQPRSPLARWSAVAAGVAWCASMGASRFLLTNHYLTDVLGGYLLGAGWLAVCVGGFERLRGRR